MDENTNPMVDSTETSAESCAAELALCKEQVAEAERRVLYARADFENYRRNVERDRALWITQAQAAVFKDLISVIDNFERALADIKKSGELAGDLQAADAARFQGFELMYRELVKLLATFNVTEVPTEGQFNPQFHEALMRVADSGKESGTIVAVLQKGYQIKDIVLRPAQVSVAE